MVRACVRACVRVCERERKREMSRERDRQTDRQTDRGTEREYGPCLTTCPALITVMKMTVVKHVVVVVVVRTTMMVITVDNSYSGDDKGFSVAGRRGVPLPHQADDEGGLHGRPFHMASRLRVGSQVSLFFLLLLPPPHPLSVYTCSRRQLCVRV